MGSKQPTPPPVPDPYATANAQGQANTNTAIAQTAMNNANEITPYGSVQYIPSGSVTVGGSGDGRLSEAGGVSTGGGGSPITVPTYTKITTLSDPQQYALWQQEGLQRQANNLAADMMTQFDTQNKQSRLALDNLPDWRYSIGDLPTFQNADLSQRGALQNLGLADTFANTANPIQYSFGSTANPIQYKIDASDATAARDQAQQALFDRLNPQLDRQADQLRTTLTNQGLAPGSDAWNNAWRDQTQTQNDARLATIAQAGNEYDRIINSQLQQAALNNAAQQQDYNQLLGRAGFNNSAQQQDYDQLLGRAQFGNQADLQNAQFNNANVESNWNAYLQALGINNQNAQQDFSNQATEAQFFNTAKQNAVQDALARSNNTVNQIAALQGLGQVSVPQFAAYNPAQMAPAPVAQSVYNSAQLANDQYKTQAQMAAANNGALFGLGGSILGTIGKFAVGSDRRLKRDIVKLGVKLPNGLDLYAYRYANDNARHVGVMADEVESVVPEAVLTMPNGFKAVDYRMVA